jgi:hypothetical protein
MQDTYKFVTDQKFPPHITLLFLHSHSFYYTWHVQNQLIDSRARQIDYYRGFKACGWYTVAGINKI